MLMCWVLPGPCENYTTLTESWRRIEASNGPSVSGLHCDSSLQVGTGGHQGRLSYVISAGGLVQV